MHCELNQATAHQLRTPRRRTLRPTTAETLFTLTLPWIALSHFSAGWMGGYSILYRIIAPYAPQDPRWEPLATGCFGAPMGPANQKAYQIVQNLAESEFVVSFLFVVLALVLSALTCIDIIQRRRPAALPSWTFAVTLAAVLGFVSFGVAAMEYSAAFWQAAGS